MNRFSHRFLVRAALWAILALTPIGSALLSVNRLSAMRAAASALAPPVYQVSVDPIVASGFLRPVQVTHAGDGSNRLFVVEQDGFIRIVKSGVVLGTPFLDVSLLSSCCGERGLLGLAFHPNYETNGYFYVNFTDNAGDTRIVRYSASSNPDVANPNSALTLLTVEQPYANHNGGQLLFGRDGYLYIGMGDGGSGGDPDHRAQDINHLLGKMLRLDVDGGTPYANPPTNPFVGKPGLDEIWAIGLRNPWRFSFDRLNGDLYIGDVGQNAWEEVDYHAYGTPSGVNFGWPCREGAHVYPSSDPRCSDPNLVAGLTPPIAEYANTGPYQAVTGGFVYRGGDFPALYGRYFFADFAAGSIWSIARSGAVWSPRITEIASTGFAISSFGEDERGELYVVDYSGGTLRRLIDALNPAPTPTPVADLTTSKKSASSPYADPGEVITYTIRLTNTGELSGQTVRLTDTLPAGLSYVPNSLTATLGTVTASPPRVLWQGPLTPTRTITITYRATATGAITGSLTNQARLTGPPIQPITLSMSLFVPRPILTTTALDFRLPGTQPGGLVDPMPDPITCDVCHTDPIYDRWRGSLMSQAGRDPLLWAALAVANNTTPTAGEFCLRCHAPRGWFAGRSSLPDGSALQPGDIGAGVTCDLCHRMVDPVPADSGTDEAKTIDADIRGALALSSTLPLTAPVGSAMLIVDPYDRRRGPFAFEPDPPHPNVTLRTDLLGQSANAVAEARLCGTCHNLDNPTLSWDVGRGQYWPNGSNLAAPSVARGDLFPIERTYEEWLNSAYARPGGVYAPSFAGSKPDGRVSTCQDCHMPRAVGKAAEDAHNPVVRDCLTPGNCLPQHTLVGGNAWVPELLQDQRWRLNSVGESIFLANTAVEARSMLRRAATVTATLMTSGTQPIAIVRVINETGHKLPTGYPEGRRMWLNVRAFSDSGALLQEWGAYNASTGRLVLDTKVYEAKHGLTPEWASVLELPAGESFHFVLNNSVVKDNRIPPRGFPEAALTQRELGMQPVGAAYQPGQYWDDTLFPVPVGTQRLTVALYYQTASKEYIDFLRRFGGADGVTLGSMWDTSKSPPVLMTLFPSFPAYLPIIYRTY